MATTATTRPESVEPTGAPAPPRVSPFALPASTTSQFLLLVALTAAVAAFGVDQLLGGPSFWADEFGVCNRAGDRPRPGASALELTRTYLDCRNGVLLRRGGAHLLGVAGVLLLTLLGVLLHPRVVVGREGLTRFRPDDFPGAGAEIERCLAEAGLRHRPEFYYESFRADRGGRAFGTRRRARIRLALDLLTDDTARPTLRAVVRHEVAHVRNRDLTLTAMVVVAPFVFVVAAAPLLLALALHAPAMVWDHAWRLAVLLGLVLLVRASVFRSREHYADVRASIVGPASDAAFLASAFPDAPTDGRRDLRQRLRGLLGLRSHPLAAARAAVVHRPARLLGSGLAEGAAAGVTAGVVFAFVRNLASSVVGGNFLYASAIAAVPVGLLAATVIGQSMWRAALAASVERRPVPTGGRAAAGLAIGLVAAEVLTPPGLAQWPALARTSPVVAVVAAGLLLLGCLVYTCWCASAATAWLAAARSRSLTPVMVAGMAVGALAFGALYATWSGAVGSAAAAPSVPGLMVRFLNPLFALPIVAATAFPLLAAVRARSGPCRARPVLLDEPRDVALVVPRMRLWTILVPAVVMALVYIVLDVVVFGGLALQSVLPVAAASAGAATDAPTAAAGQANALLLFFVAAELLAVSVAAFAVVRGRLFGAWGHLYLAAVTAGLLIGVAVLAYPSVLLCSTTGCSAFVSVGGPAILALATTLVAGVVTVPVWLVVTAARTGRRLVRRASPGPPEPQTPAGRGTAARVWSAVGAVVAGPLALAYTVAVTFALLISLNVVPIGGQTVGREITEAPDDRTPTTTPVACGAFNLQQQDTDIFNIDPVQRLRTARALASVTDYGVVRTAGVLKEQSILTADGTAQGAADSALTTLCQGHVPAPLPASR